MPVKKGNKTSSAQEKFVAFRLLQAIRKLCRKEEWEQESECSCHKWKQTISTIFECFNFIEYCAKCRRRSAVVPSKQYFPSSLDFYYIWLCRDFDDFLFAFRWIMLDMRARRVKKEMRIYDYSRNMEQNGFKKSVWKCNSSSSTSTRNKHVDGKSLLY